MPSNESVLGQPFLGIGRIKRSSFHYWESSEVPLYLKLSFNFQPSRMTVERDSEERVFHVSLCGHNSHCSQSYSFCYTDSSGDTHDVASYSIQTIMTQGTVLNAVLLSLPSVLDAWCPVCWMRGLHGLCTIWLPF